MVQILKKNYKTSITFPVEDKFSCMDDLISFLKATAEEINVITLTLLFNIRLVFVKIVFI